MNQDSGVTLFPYQAEAVAAIRDHLNRYRRTLLVMPTGTGKTVVFAEAVKPYRGERILMVAHRKELLEQAERKFRAAGLSTIIDKGTIGSRRAYADVRIASIQSMQRRLWSWAPNAFGLIIIDEAHHATAKGYRELIERFPKARVLGATATPDRLDGEALGSVFNSTAYVYDLRKAFAERLTLTRVLARRVVLENVDLSNVRITCGDLNEKDLAKAMNNERATHGVALSLLSLAGTRKTIVFSVTVGHARAIAEVMNKERPGCAEIAHGSLTTAEREAVLGRFRTGAVQFLINCQLYTEGFDEPDVACIAVARPTQSRSLYMQMIGRGLRKHESKSDCLLVDFTANSSRHELVGPADALAGKKLSKAVSTACAKASTDETVDLYSVIDREEASAVVEFVVQETAPVRPAAEDEDADLMARAQLQARRVRQANDMLYERILGILSQSDRPLRVSEVASRLSLDGRKVGVRATESALGTLEGRGLAVLTYGAWTIPYGGRWRVPYTSSEASSRLRDLEAACKASLDSVVGKTSRAVHDDVCERAPVPFADITGALWRLERKKMAIVRDGRWFGVADAGMQAGTVYDAVAGRYIASSRRG